MNGRLTRVWDEWYIYRNGETWHIERTDESDGWTIRISTLDVRRGPFDCMARACHAADLAVMLTTPIESSKFQVTKD